MGQFYRRAEKYIGSLKFAVIIILLFSVAMIIGTFVESYYGTDFANRLIYKTIWFMGIQFFMFLSILFATFLRLPMKKRLYGFYVIHTGLITIGIGSFVTYVSGIDGSINLPPMSPTRQIILNDDVIEVIKPYENKRATVKLPYTALATTMNAKYGDIEITQFYPFAKKQTVWKESETEKTKKLKFIHSSEYIISNPNVTQDFTLTLHPEAHDHKSSMRMGLLDITYLPFGMFKCFKENNPSKLILWNSKTEECQTVEQLGIDLQKTSSGKRFFAIREENRVFSFIPDLSPWALDGELQPILDSPYRAFSKNLFEKKPHLFLFGQALAYYDKDESKWVHSQITTKQKVELPWMGFELSLVKHGKRDAPLSIPLKTLPIQQNGALVVGALKAAKVKVRDQEYWLTNERPINLMIDGVETRIYLTKKSLTLPFELTLNKFNMDKDPGTNNPASYESFVNLFRDGENSNHHIFMNNPLKYDGFTFYQASYSQDPDTGQYSSTLSVNVDQGRFLKYLGSLLLVLGACWHYTLNKKKKTKESDLLGIEG